MAAANSLWNWGNAMRIRVAQGTIDDVTPKRKRCDRCEAAYINGIFCHELGCPNIRKVWNPVDGTWDEPDREED